MTSARANAGPSFAVQIRDCCDIVFLLAVSCVTISISFQVSFLFHRSGLQAKAPIPSRSHNEQCCFGVRSSSRICCWFQLRATIKPWRKNRNSHLLGAEDGFDSPSAGGLGGPVGWTSASYFFLCSGVRTSDTYLVSSSLVAKSRGTF